MAGAPADQRLQQYQQRPQHQAGGEGNAIRIAGTDDLGQDLREHDQQQRHEGDGNDQHGLVVPEHGDGNQRDQDGSERIDQRAGDQHHGQHPVGTFKQPQRGRGASAAAARQVAQPVPADCHQGRFGHRKKRGEEYQYCQRNNLRPQGNGIQSVTVGS
jgi:hypothetical protein